MEVKISVDELQFKELLDGELKNLPKEKIQEIILEGIRTYLTNDKVFEGLFLEKQEWSFSRPKASSYLREIIKNSIPDDSFSDVRDEIINNLKNNYNEILKVAMTDLMINGLFYNDNFISSIKETLYRIRAEESNRDSY